MMDKNEIGLYNLRPPVGSRHRRKILGRGQGSGHGGTSTKGHKGQNSRSGGKRSPTFEGGQMPIYRRLPKRGFTNIFKEPYQIINIEDLGKFEVDVTPEALKRAGFNRRGIKIKILGKGELTRPITVHASSFSKTAVEKIENAGGKAITEKY